MWLVLMGCLLCKCESEYLKAEASHILLATEQGCNVLKGQILNAPDRFIEVIIIQARCCFFYRKLPSLSIISNFVYFFGAVSKRRKSKQVCLNSSISKNSLQHVTLLQRIVTYVCFSLLYFINVNIAALVRPGKMVGHSESSALVKWYRNLMKLFSRPDMSAR